MFGKHYTSMYSGSMRGAGAVAFAVWGYIISHVVPPDFELELNPEIIGFLIGEPEDRIVAVLEKFCLPDLKSRTQEHEGRKLVKRGTYLYFVVNGEIYHNIRNEEEKRAYWRDQKKRYREKQNGQSDPEPEALTEPTIQAVSSPRFQKPTREELDFYAAKIGLPPAEVDKFVNFYDSKGWMVGKNHMKDWEAAMRGWKVRWEENRKYETRIGSTGQRPVVDRNAGTLNAGRSKDYANVGKLLPVPNPERPAT